MECEMCEAKFMGHIKDSTVLVVKDGYPADESAPGHAVLKWSEKFECPFCGATGRQINDATGSVANTEHRGRLFNGMSG